jgi:aryl-alcohol dehydrogenase-like predicted oxidoreductase
MADRLARAGQRRIASLEPSVCGLGCNNFGMGLDRAESLRIVAAALDSGITFFDTASSYGGGLSEQFLGEALRRDRDRVVIATKVSSGSRTAVKDGIEQSLTRLGTDRVDLFLLHKPDPQAPLEETLSAMFELADAGLVREIGCSNFSARQLAESHATARRLGVPGFVNAQNRYNLLERGAEAEVIPELLRTGMSLVPYFPLASGVLTGKYRRGAPWPANSRFAAWKGADRLDHYVEELYTPRNLEIAERLGAFAAQHGHTLPELALSWLVGSPAVASVIVGATSEQQVRSNAAAITAWTLTEEERAEIDRLTGQEPA